MVMEPTDRDDAVWYAQGKYYFVTAVELQTCTCFSLKAWTLDEQDGESPPLQLDTRQKTCLCSWHRLEWN